jgi:hypothetical protein
MCHPLIGYWASADQAIFRLKEHLYVVSPACLILVSYRRQFKLENGASVCPGDTQIRRRGHGHHGMSLLAQADMLIAARDVRFLGGKADIAQTCFNVR